MKPEATGARDPGRATGATVRDSGVVSDTPDIYVHGHHESVLRSHTWRTVENSAAYLVPHLRSDLRLLDIGCGPGTITVDFAERLPDGEVVGLDPVRNVLEEAEELRAERGLANCRFEPGDVYRLPFDDDSFDIVHAHQVLQHLSDPVAALREMHRVVVPNGVVAVRDADYAAMSWAPADPVLDGWKELYHAITSAANAEADAGRYLLGWAQQAGFTAISASSSTWTFATPSERAWWGSLWADRVRYSSFADQALEGGFATRTDLDEIAEAWHRWSAHDDGYFVVVHGEIIAVK